MLSDSLLDSLMNVALKYRDQIDPGVMLPRINWRHPRNERRTQNSTTGHAAMIETSIETSIENSDSLGTASVAAGGSNGNRGTVRSARSVNSKPGR